MNAAADPDAAARAEAEAFWRQHEVPLDYAKPWKLKGVVEALREVKNARDQWVPRLAVRGVLATDDRAAGERLYVVTAHPSRLRAELVLAAPAVGDRIWIEYIGEDPKAPAGLNKTKRFRVVVKPFGSPPPPPAESFGEVAPSGPEAGK